MSPAFGTTVLHPDVVDRVVTYLVDHTSHVQRQLLIKISKGNWASYPGDGVTGPTLEALDSKGLINRTGTGWQAEITWLGSMAVARLEAEEPR